MVQATSADAGAECDHPKFAGSTLTATAWLIRFAPERLAAWIDGHPFGPQLEKETRRLIAKKKALVDRKPDASRSALH